MPAALPALQRAARLCEKAVAAGFAWEDAGGALAKLEEEVRELREACSDPEARGGEAGRARVEAELGDVLLAGSFLARSASIPSAPPARPCGASSAGSAGWRPPSASGSARPP